jgi:hypothetical protein
MRRLTGLAFALAAGLTAPGAHAAPANCADMYSDGVARFGWDTFFRKAAFGTVGFARDDKLVVFAPKDGVDCVVLPRPNRHLYIVFNHRQSPRGLVGYVSFKAYGMNLSKAPTQARELYRTGGWYRDPHAAALPDDLPAHNGLPKPDPAIITGYEAFYRAGGNASLADFDRMFGHMHGIPAQGQASSWEDRQGMQPANVDLSKVVWLRHDLQRVEVVADASGSNNPPLLDTTQHGFNYILAFVASTLGTPSRQLTLWFR